MEDILIDLFVGRDLEDLRILDLYYRKRFASTKSLASVVNQLTSSEELRAALSVCTETSSTRGTQVVDQQLVLQDVAAIQEELTRTFPYYQVIFDILLRRHNTHIAQINLFYQMREGKNLDEAIRRNVCFSDIVKKITVHAVRTAIDLSYRDCMLLRDAMGANSHLGTQKDEKLGIRVCRMHWHKQHWTQIKALYVGHMGHEFIEKCKKGKQGMFRDLMVQMALI